MDVALVRWPAGAAEREALACEGAPRLLLVESDAEPPEPGDCLEDWIRLPATKGDVGIRMAHLAARAAYHVQVTPGMDDEGVLSFGPTRVTLPPVEWRLTAAMVERFGAVVSRDSLSEAGWPQGAPGRNALDVHVLRLRRRLAPAGLAIRTVRSRGYLMEAWGTSPRRVPTPFPGSGGEPSMAEAQPSSR
ncbi:MAG TPA: helix-turn-helix domain-containing protein [Acidimicrobiales bacterium]